MDAGNIINTIICGDSLNVMKYWPNDCIDCVVTSPPYYGLRNYLCNNFIGLEPTLDEYLDKLVAVFREVRRVLKSTGTFWLNIANSYCTASKGTGGKSLKQCSNSGSFYESGSLSAGSWIGKKNNMNRIGPVPGYKNKDLLPVAWLLALALQKDGWWLRNDVIWAKPNPMPESITDRCTKAHEYVFLLTKSETYYFDMEAIKEPSIDLKSIIGRKFWGRKAILDAGVLLKKGGIHDFSHCEGKKYPLRHKRDVWIIAVNKPKICKGHFAVFPEKLVEPCVLAGSPEGGIVLDPFCGSGTSCKVAKNLGRNYIGIDISERFCRLARNRVNQAERGLF